MKTRTKPIADKEPGQTYKAFNCVTKFEVNFLSMEIHELHLSFHLDIKTYTQICRSSSSKYHSIQLSLTDIIIECCSSSKRKFISMLYLISVPKICRLREQNKTIYSTAS